MKKDYCSMRFAEKDAKVFYKRMVNKRSKQLNKILYQKVGAPGTRIVFVPAEEDFTKTFQSTGGKSEKGKEEAKQELNSKRNFDLIRRRTEIRKK